MHKQRGKSTCGPDALGVIAAQFGITQQAVDDAFGCPDINKFVNLMDTPANHIAAMRKLGLKYRTVTDVQIINGECAMGETIVLLHSLDDPKTLEPENVTIQHWAVVVAVLDNCVMLDMGTPDLKAKAVTYATFKALYAGVPTKTAWEITGVATPSRPKWWVRAWVAISSFFRR